MKVFKGIKKSIMSLSFQERKKKRLEKYQNRIAELKKMKDDELDLEYITLKSEYERRKTSMSVFMASIVIAVLMRVWSYFYDFLKKIMEYLGGYSNSNIEVAKVAFMIAACIIFVVTFTIVFILIVNTRSLYRVYNELIIVEEYRNAKRKKDGK